MFVYIEGSIHTYSHIFIHAYTYIQAINQDFKSAKNNLAKKRHTHTHTYIHTYIHAYIQAINQDFKSAKNNLAKKRHTYTHTYMHAYTHTFRPSTKL